MPWWGILIIVVVLIVLWAISVYNKLVALRNRVKDQWAQIDVQLKRRFDLSYNPSDEILVTVGGSEGIDIALRALVGPGDEVLIPEPSFVAYKGCTTFTGAKANVLELKAENDFKLTADELEEAITENTKVVIIPFPNNPTGAIMTREELAPIVEVLKKKDVIIISDEIYAELTYNKEHVSIASFPEIKDRTLVINGFSKAYAMTGWRIGFLAGPEWIIKGCNKLQGQYTSGTCSVSQKAAEAAYTLDQSAVEEMRVAFERRRNLIVKLAKEVPGLEVNMPQGAFYLFPKCNSYFGKSNGEKTINNSTDFAMYLLEEAHVATVGGDAFGDPDCFRMSYATSDENIVEAIKRIKEALGKLK